MKHTDDPIVVDQIFETSVEVLWNTITRVRHMKQWFFENIESFEPEVGFETSFKVQVGDRSFTHLWKVTEVIHNQRIIYNWRYEEYPGDSFITFELMDEGPVVKLTVTAVIIEDFPEDIPEFSRQSGLDGWNYFIKKSLKDYLSN